jgi:hypothetical protein
MAHKIQIQNGTSGEREYTSLDRANFFVAARRAVWISANCIRFTGTDYRVVSSRKSARPAKTFVDTPGFATLDGLKHTPVIQPLRLLTGKKPLVPPVAIRVVELSRRPLIQSF